MVDDLGIGAASSRASAEAIVRRHARSGEGFTLSVLEANMPGRASFAAVSDARRAPHSELAKAGGSAELARCSAKYS